MSNLFRAAICGIVLVTAPMAPAIVHAQGAPTANAKLSSDSPMSVLLADPKSKAILQSHIPIIVENADMIPNVETTSLKQLAQNERAVSQGGLSPEALKQIEDDLAKL
jgi:hypothetical protein